jgi:mono/diheme cytochrome c family protein
VELGQGWSDGERQIFWFLTQGSRLLDYRWFVSLEEASGPALFKDGLARFGFIPARQSTVNQDALPIGVTRDRPGPDAKVGLTCAACHTSRLSLQGTPVIIEGGPTLVDFELFMKQLEVAMGTNGTNLDKFERFATRVLGAGAGETEKQRLKRDLDAATTVLRTHWNAHWPAMPSGPGRIDAFGQIFNQVAAYAIKAPQNARVADAPVSYPFLWNAPQLDVVQWNGSASNGLFGLGPLFRNVGEALGVFGEVTVEKKKFPEYVSSLNLAGLRTLEDMLKTLRPPAWPSRCAPIDRALAAAGRLLYKQYCARCHTPLDRTDTTTSVRAAMVPVTEVGTDTAMVQNYADRFEYTRIETGILEGQRKTFFPFPRFGERAKGIELLSNVILGAVRGKGAGAPTARAQEDQREADTQVPLLRSTMEYKAGPLTGVWATAPYLHNGSVPNLAELLTPAKDRVPTFYVGNNEFDFKNVGLSIDPSPGAVLFDTRTGKGNRNTGHTGQEYGTELTTDEKRALLEYLKVVGETGFTD